ncbi:hypothetical protein DL96DRAFT_1810342 [Flagelloscypha sp. PMI_526]|nr:hypothetical protein DL96DRAFT_1810342 [Flagelloscypha sp. PMI_526]
MTPQELALLYQAADTSYLASVKVLSITSFYGAFLIVFLFSVTLLHRRLNTSAPAKWLYVLVLLLGVTMTLHFAAGIITFLPEILWVKYGSMEDPIATKFALGQSANDVSSKISAFAPSVNFALGDTIVVWRAYVLWPNSRAFRFIIAALLLVTTMFAIIYYALTVQATLVISRSLIGSLGGVRYSLSLLLNVVATSAMGVKTWKHRQEVKHVMNGSSRSFISKVLLLLTECGALFCLSQLIVAILQGTTTKYARTNPTHPAYIATVVMIELCVAFAGMYPSIVVIALDLYGSFLEADPSEFDIRTAATLDLDAIPMSDSTSSNRSPTEKSSHPHNFSPIRFAEFETIQSQEEAKRSISRRAQQRGGYLRPLTIDRRSSFVEEEDVGDMESLHRHPTPTAI